MQAEKNQGIVCVRAWGLVACVISLPMNFSTVKFHIRYLVVRRVVILITKVNEIGVNLG